MSSPKPIFDSRFFSCCCFSFVCTRQTLALSLLLAFRLNDTIVVCCACICRVVRDTHSPEFFTSLYSNCHLFFSLLSFSLIQYIFIKIRYPLCLLPIVLMLRSCNSWCTCGLWSSRSRKTYILRSVFCIYVHLVPFIGAASARLTHINSICQWRQ